MWGLSWRVLIASYSPCWKRKDPDDRVTVIGKSTLSQTGNIHRHHAFRTRKRKVPFTHRASCIMQAAYEIGQSGWEPMGEVPPAFPRGHD